MTSSITKFRIHLRRASRNAITDLRKNVPKFTNRKLRTIRTLRYEKQAPVQFVFFILCFVCTLFLFFCLSFIFSSYFVSIFISR